MNRNVNQIRTELMERYPDLPLPKQSYLILMSPRSGSSLLCAHLERIGFGKPTEGFHFSKRALIERFGEGIDFSDSYQHILSALNYGTENGVFGLKLSWIEFEIFLSQSRQLIGPHASILNDLDIMDVFFPKTRIIWLKRRNKVKQAVSYSKAMQTGIWRESFDSSDEFKEYVLPAEYNRDHIEALFDNLLAFDLSWGTFIQQNKIKCLEIWYEDLAKDYLKTVTIICEYLGAKNKVSIDPPLKRQSDEVSQLWVEKFQIETPWLKEPLIEFSLNTGDFTTVFFQRSMAQARKREKAVWKSLPYNKNKELKRLIFRAKKRLGIK